MSYRATITSVARLIVYYYRYSPSNRDRAYNIGLVTSIVEPSVGIIAACAPALRRLFTYFVPQYFSEEATSYRTHTAGQDKSPHRRSFSFHNSAGKEVVENRMDMGREEQIYGMKQLGSVDSEEQIEDEVVEPPNRTRSVKTGISEGPSEALEAEPKHFLNYK